MAAGLPAFGLSSGKRCDGKNANIAIEGILDARRDRVRELIYKGCPVRVEIIFRL